MNLKSFSVLFVFSLLVGQAYGSASIEGGWGTESNGDAINRGTSEVSYSGGDPSITLGISQYSSLYGPGSTSDTKTGSQSITINLGGFNLTVGYSGTVSSSLNLQTAGSGSTMAFITATATGTSTGLQTYDMSGSADVGTQGSIIGIGSGSASASGSANYDASKDGSQAEVWGTASGTSTLSFETETASSMVNTLGTQNGLHTDSRTILDSKGVRSSSSNSRITAYASSINDARINVSASGTAQGGAWGPAIMVPKARLSNEDCASSASGTATGYAESNGASDSANSYATIQTAASGSGNESVLSVSGGPSTYASSVQTSSSPRTWSESWVKGASWGSVARSNTGLYTIEYGQLSSTAAGAQVYQPGAHALSFGKIALATNMTTGSLLSNSYGSIALDTYTEATKNKNAVAGAIVGITGNGTIASSDGLMTNNGSFLGGLYHYSNIQGASNHSETYNIIGKGNLTSDPSGYSVWTQPFTINSVGDPIIAWSRTTGTYYQEHY